MRTENQKFHSATLQMHKSLMFQDLLYPHHLMSRTEKIYTFENDLGQEKTVRGNLALKDVDEKTIKYVVPQDKFEDLPFRVTDEEEVFFKEGARARSVVILPKAVTPFRVKAERCWEHDHDFINALAPFEHSHPTHWTLSKIVAVASYVSKTFIGVCGEPAFGKTSLYLILDALTSKSPVMKPRSIPGLLVQITGDGILALDDVHATTTEVKGFMETFVFTVAGGDPVYINGAVKSKDTKASYDIVNQSIVFLYNTWQNYKDPESEFWDNLWKGKEAMQSRFLRLKFDGTLTEKFDKDFDIKAVAQENKMFYMKIVKHLLYLKDLRARNAHTLRYKPQETLKLPIRHEASYQEIVWLLDLYCINQAEFDSYLKLLNDCIRNYQKMLGGPLPSVKPLMDFSGMGIGPQEVPMPDPCDNIKGTIEGIERVNKIIEKFNKEPDKTRILAALGTKEMSYETLEEFFPDIKNIDQVLQAMLTAGEILQVSAGKLRRVV